MYLDREPRINHLKVTHPEEDSRNVEYSAFDLEPLGFVLRFKGNYL